MHLDQIQLMDKLVRFVQLEIIVQVIALHLKSVLQELTMIRLVQALNLIANLVQPEQFVMEQDKLVKITIAQQEKNVLMVV